MYCDKKKKFHFVLAMFLSFQRLIIALSNLEQEHYNVIMVRNVLLI